MSEQTRWALLGLCAGALVGTFAIVLGARSCPRGGCENMAEHGGLMDTVRELSAQLSVLGVSGVAGACFRAIIAPEESWRRRIVQGVAGAISAVFLGGLLGHMLDAALDAGIYAFAAAGFIMGNAGEYGVKVLQDRMIGKRKSDG